VGAAKFIRGLVRQVAPERLTVIVNTGDDDVFYGMRVSPDIDTVTYTLAGVANAEHGWGRADETWTTRDELARFYGRAWFNLGDRDMANQLYRTERLAAGARLSAITAEVALAFGVRARVLPMTDDPVRTFVKLRGRKAIPFQEYFVRGRARGAVQAIELRGANQARPAPGVLGAIRTSAATILAPSNPFVSLGPIFALRGVRPALRAARARVAAISPIIGGKTVKGPADKMLRGLGMEVSALAVARLYRDIAGVFVLDTADRALAPEIERLGMRAVVTNTIMSTPARSSRLAQVVLRALGV
jgi:LPPG:FO 2-phospho-L-lactate transferase